MLSCQKGHRRLIAIIIFIFSMNLAALETPYFTGSFQQGGLVLGHLNEDQTVSYKGKVLPLNNKRQFLLGFGRNEPATTKIIVHKKSVDTTIILNVAPRQYAIQKIEGVPQKTVTPSTKDKDPLPHIKQSILEHDEQATYRQTPTLEGIMVCKIQIAYVGQ